MFRQSGRDEKRPEDNREKEEFHVLPGRFVNGTEESDKWIFSAPFIEEMSQCSEDGCEYEACDKICF